jgi:hypothetical protein
MFVINESPFCDHRNSRWLGWSSSLVVVEMVGFRRGGVRAHVDAHQVALGSALLGRRNGSLDHGDTRLGKSNPPSKSRAPCHSTHMSPQPASAFGARTLVPTLPTRRPPRRRLDVDLAVCLRNECDAPMFVAAPNPRPRPRARGAIELDVLSARYRSELRRVPIGRSMVARLLPKGRNSLLDGGVGLALTGPGSDARPNFRTSQLPGATGSGGIPSSRKAFPRTSLWMSRGSRCPKCFWATARELGQVLSGWG